MYNPQLKTFLQVADAGSFSKAAAQQFITAPALIKQINLLEKSLGVALFQRTHRGLVLTEPGKVLYQEAKHIIRYCDSAAHRIRQVATCGSRTVRIGFSPLTPANILVDHLPQIHVRCPDLQVEMVPFVNNITNAVDILTHLGQEIDVVLGIFDSAVLSLRKCAGSELYRIPFCCAVSTAHPLARKTKLTIRDLYGEEVMLIHRNWGDETNMLRMELGQHPMVRVVDFDCFEMEIFNRCVNRGAVLIAVPGWENVHPQIKLIPVEWNFTIPYGLLHSTEPSAAVREFLDAARKTIQETSPRL